MSENERQQEMQQAVEKGKAHFMETLGNLP
jgi:hypothetical protein